MPVQRAGFFLTMLIFTAPVFSQDWYLSNPSGMAVERAVSKTAALRAEWAVSVEQTEESRVPGILRPYYENGFSVELRVLYNRGNPVRRQWIFASGPRIRLNASFPVKENQAEGPLPFIELYSPDSSAGTQGGNAEYLLTELLEIQPSGGRYSTRYRYSGGLLAGTETRLDGTLLWNDEYRYTRNFRLRGIERRYAPALPAEHGDAAGEGADETPVPETVRLRFPPPGLSFISPDSPYDYGLKTGALRDAFKTNWTTVRYNVDEQGRISYEEHVDDAGNITASLANEWDGEKLLSVVWKADGVSGRVEFDYSPSGAPAGERDYRNDVLERRVTNDGDREIEELYRDGRPILRAVWENGRKITEERL
ncbi:MAG: hypothetical protein LBI67_00965 [Treponema sp.]|jgi:hypothetical protein|nr:hypothetical protein [Treponema sp.]